jgi:hypothetical protein
LTGTGLLMEGLGALEVWPNLAQEQGHPIVRETSIQSRLFEIKIYWI